MPLKIHPEIWKEDMMHMSKLETDIEAILFTMGRSVSVSELQAVLEVDAETVHEVIQKMMTQYEAEERGVKIIRLDDAYQMCTNPSAYDAIIRLTHQPKKHTLTDVMLETLSIIAYKQPVTRSVVEQIRGVNSDRAINKLVEYQLVCEMGRLDAPGRPILFGTTEEFLRTFGLKSSEELPLIDPVKVEEFKNEAEEEADIQINV